MALSKQSAPASRLVAFANWCITNGYTILEMEPFEDVNKGVHNAKSWHYDSANINGRRYSLALDLNWKGTPAQERAKLIYAVRVARSMGLAVIYAQYGVNSVTKPHQTHAHIDVGSNADLGLGHFKPAPGSMIVWGMQPALHDKRTNLWDADFDKRLAAVRASSGFGGGKFPHGKAYTQRVVGTNDDGVWGPKSRAAHDKTMRAIQKVLGVKQTARWDAATETAYKKYRAQLKGKW